MTAAEYDATLAKLQRAIVIAPSWKARAKAQAELREWQRKNLEDAA